MDWAIAVGEGVLFSFSICHLLPHLLAAIAKSLGVGTWEGKGKEWLRVVSYINWYYGKLAPAFWAWQMFKTDSHLATLGGLWLLPLLDPFVFNSPDLDKASPSAVHFPHSS